VSGCFGSSKHDRWMEGQLNAYLAQQEAPSDFDIDFYMGMSKGTVRVRGKR